MKSCSRCKRRRAASSYKTLKDGSRGAVCSPCRKSSAARHRRRYYASLPRDKAHTLASQRRAQSRGVRAEEYSRTAIFERWDHRCAYCNARAEHLDHVVPLSRGGEDVESNLLPACAPCNLSKGALSLAEWAWRSLGYVETEGAGA